MITKIARTVEMSFDIPESEKKIGKEAEELFEKVLAILDIAKKHLNEMYDPFRDAGTIEPAKLHEIRGVVFRYKEQIKKNFEQVKRYARAAIIKFNHFKSDTHAMELINTFQDSFGEVEAQVNILVDILNDVKADDFKDRYIVGVQSILKKSFELENLVKDRIIDYLDTNILTKNWMTDVDGELQGNVAERVPYVTELFNERQKALGS